MADPWRLDYDSPRDGIPAMPKAFVWCVIAVALAGAVPALGALSAMKHLQRVEGFRVLDMSPRAGAYHFWLEDVPTCASLAGLPLASLVSFRRLWRSGERLYALLIVPVAAGTFVVSIVLLAWVSFEAFP